MSVIVKNGGGGKSSGLYVWKKYEIVPTYLSFLGNEDFTLETANTTKNWDGALEYSTDKSTWNTWDGTEISSAGGKLYLRGTGNTKITGKYIEYGFVFTGADTLKIACEGNIENLLDYGTVIAGGHPTMAEYCFAFMFREGRLITLPKLPATTLVKGCYRSMFANCPYIKLSATQTGEYQVPYRIPKSGTGITATDALLSMFYNTGGTFTGTPEINTTYYLSTSNTVV